MTSLPVVKNSLESYLTQINQFPLLTQEEEFKLATRYRKDNDSCAKLITSI
jgi:DNA-directed RNA polymerase sigma subunit (sigma70/sigma32)